MTSKIIKDSSAMGQFGSAIAQICEEKGIDKERVVESIEAALAAAYKKDYGKRGQLIMASLQESSGEVEFYQLKEVVDESMRLMEEMEEEEGDAESEDQDPKKKNTKKEEENFQEARKSEKLAEKFKKMREKARELSGEEEEGLPKFNPERDILWEEAKKVDKEIVAGDFLEIPLESRSDYGRVASQTAKQVIIQRIREAERDSMYEEYKGKEGEIISGSIQRIEGGKVYIEMGKAVGVLFPSEQIPSEQYRVGQRIRVYVDRVESDLRGPGIVLSRRHPNLLVKLFELEVPEIFAGTVEIKSVAREAGNRAKIAVASNEEEIDPIGSCVGQKGTRVQAVIDELDGEKIDIIEWSDDPEKLIASALLPAKVIKVEVIGEEEKKARAFVMEDQLSLAIGRRGQNVRLAVKLSGWDIDVEALKVEDKEGDQQKVEEEVAGEELAAEKAEGAAIEVQEDEVQRAEELEASEEELESSKAASKEEATEEPVEEVKETGESAEESKEEEKEEKKGKKQTKKAPVKKTAKKTTTKKTTTKKPEKEKEEVEESK